MFVMNDVIRKSTGFIVVAPSWLYLPETKKSSLIQGRLEIAVPPWLPVHEYTGLSKP